MRLLAAALLSLSGATHAVADAAPVQSAPAAGTTPAPGAGTATTTADLGTSECPVPDSSSPEQWQGQHVWDALAAGNYRIGRISIQVDGVFDLGNPDEDTWYGRTADALHVNTHPGVIESELLIKSAQTVDPRRIYETERRLRALPYLRYADIVPVSCEFNTVDLEVHVKDAWSLKFDLNFAHVGGQSSLGASFQDVDFLGSGKTLAVGHQSDVQRSRNQLSYRDPALFGGRWELATTYAHLSDGYIRSLDLGQPFYEDEVPWSFYIHYLDQQQNLNFYNQSVVAWLAPDTQQRLELDWMKLLDWEGDSGMRAGVSYVSQQYDYGRLRPFPQVTLARPKLTDRRFAGPAATWQYFQDRYGTFTNLALIGRTEDYNLGWNTSAQVGYFGTAFDSLVPAWFYSTNASYGADYDDDTVLLATGSLQGRHQQGRDQNVLANLVFTIYNRSFGRHTLVAHGELDYSLRADPENLQYLGGIQGMPGYPNYFLIGDRRWQAHFSDRYLTDLHLFNVFQIGFALYADAGQIRQLTPSAWSRTLIDAGIALRLGDIRSAYGGVIYVTYAWPLVKLAGATDRQFVIGNLLSF